MWYRQGTPHTVVTEKDYKQFCPLGYNPSEPIVDSEVDPRLDFLKLDSHCQPLVQWCEMHPEVQGVVRHITWM